MSAGTVLTPRVDAWRREGAAETVAGRRLFVRRREGAEPLLLFLHGFPSSSYDFRRVDRLVGDHAVLTFDLLGFGLSEKPRDVVPSLAWQADAAEELVRRSAAGAVFVVAHDMGTSVATELLARDLAGSLDFRLVGALLFNGSIVLHRASPTIGQRLLRSPAGPVFARLSTETTFRWQFARLFSGAHPLSAEEAADQWALLSHAGGQRIAHRLIRYMDERERFADRWHGAVRDWPGALSLAWGLRDPVATEAVLDSLRQLRPGVPVAELPDLGHYPQIEDPPAIAREIASALRRAGQPSGQPSRSTE